MNWIIFIPCNVGFSVSIQIESNIILKCFQENWLFTITSCIAGCFYLIADNTTGDDEFIVSKPPSNSTCDSTNARLMLAQQTPDIHTMLDQCWPASWNQHWSNIMSMCRVDHLAIIMTILYRVSYFSYSCIAHPISLSPVPPPPSSPSL